MRPAFTRLVRSTQDVEEAQKLLNLALDLSAATGKPLETVTNALGRAYDGNTTALGKLGLGIDKTDLASQTFDQTFNQLTSTFGQFAENEAETTTKQMERVKIALDEAKESIGAALLPIVQQLTKYILEQFRKNPIAAVAFCMLLAVSYLYVDLRSGYKEQIEKSNQKIDALDLKIDRLSYALKKSDSALALSFSESSRSYLRNLSV